MSDIDTPEGGRRGIDRRTLIKRAAATGAVAWTAPLIIDSLASPAAALTCTGACFRAQFPAETGLCNGPSVAVSGPCNTTSANCSSTVNIGAGTTYGALCITPPAGANTCTATSSPTFTLNTTSATCFTSTQGSCAAPRRFLAAGAATVAGVCVNGTINGTGTTVTFTLPAGAQWASFQFLIGCGCS
jgi:hypothetical protein